MGRIDRPRGGFDPARLEEPSRPAAIVPKIVEAPFATALVELGDRRDDVVVLSADLSRYTDVLPFAERFPERFVQCGMAEQNMLGVAGGLAWWNWFLVPVRGVVHEHDAFHYYVGARYFRELGYAQLYRCALAADLEAGLDPGPRLRDLETNRLLPATTQLDAARACRARFAPERWQAFARDLDWFRARLAPRAWQQIREDHGFNGSPVWLLAADRVTANANCLLPLLPSTADTLPTDTDGSDGEDGAEP